MQHNAPVSVSDINTVILPNHRAAAVRNQEYCPGHRISRVCYKLLDCQRLLWVVGKGQTIVFIGLHRYGLRFGI